jgi:hypothetical protein
MQLKQSKLGGWKVDDFPTIDVVWAKRWFESMGLVSPTGMARMRRFGDDIEAIKAGRLEAE